MGSEVAGSAAADTVAGGDTVAGDDTAAVAGSSSAEGKQAAGTEDPDSAIVEASETGSDSVEDTEPSSDYGRH